MYRKNAALLMTVGLLCALEYLQAGMIAFASAPIRGEIDASPEEFTLVAALYACIAVVVISKQRWLVERLGWRNFMLGSISVYVLGAVVCGISGDLTSFTVGRVVMALGGASFMTSARLMVNLLPPGPGRFVGVKVFATGLASGTAAAPFLSSLAVVEDTWHAIFWLLIAGAVAAGVLCMRFLPSEPIHEDERSPSSPANILLLSVSTFFLLYVLQRSYYDFYNESIILLAFALLAALGVYIFFHAEHAKDEPFLKVKDLMQSRYILGVGLFCFTYIVLGSNNYILPYFLQSGLGYSWDTIGTFQAFGLAGALLTWFAMALVIPKYPAPKKFFVVGFAALISFGLLLSSLTLDANMWSHILPALVLNGCFVMLVLATAAMQTFRDVTHHDTLFAHAYQIKSMLGQIAMAIGTTLATLFLQWRSTLQYNNLNGHFNPGDPLYQDSAQRLTLALTPAVGAGPANQIAVATLAQDLHQQATLVASMEYFWVVIVVAGVALGVSMVQKTFK
ncbi:MFS transporter [Pseudomonas extremaustralis]|jgi:MFS transporter, DHA2 family, multidrug resistance protein|uniref:MFS transporter n=1 Tax=Pseudomonas extremaustralis TaxID=359110 RepID=UPI002AA7814B|nr:MFS transporter [Pseudomonas extremaustralis]